MTKEEHILNFVRYAKGTKVLRRALPLLSPEALTGYAFSLLRVFEQLNILDPQAPADHVASFLRGVMQPLTTVFEHMNLAKATEALEILVNHSLFGVFSIARSKVGLSLMEMLLVRAQQIRLGDQPSHADLENWTHAFAAFFALMESNYLNLLTISEQYLSTEIWTFFTLLSMHSSQEQRFALLSEIRDRVMEVVRNQADTSTRPLVFQLLQSMGINPSELY